MKKRLVIIIALLAILIIALSTGYVLMLRLFALAVLLILLSYLWVLLSAGNITGKAKVSSRRRQVGEWFSEEITVTNNSRLPKLSVQVSGNTDLPGYNNKAVIDLSPWGSHSWQTEQFLSGFRPECRVPP